MTHVTVRTDEGYRTHVTAGGHTWVNDEPADIGGTDLGPSPMQALLGAVGSCTVITLHMYANRKGWPLEKVDIDLTIEKLPAAGYPGYDGDASFVHDLRMTLTLHGDLDADQRARLMEIATKCPVRRVVEGPTFVHETEAQPA